MAYRNEKMQKFWKDIIDFTSICLHTSQRIIKFWKEENESISEINVFWKYDSTQSELKIIETIKIRFSIKDRPNKLPTASIREVR